MQNRFPLMPMQMRPFLVPQNQGMNMNNVNINQIRPMMPTLPMLNFNSQQYLLYQQRLMNPYLFQQIMKNNQKPHYHKKWNN